VEHDPATPALQRARRPSQRLLVLLLSVLILHARVLILVLVVAPDAAQGRQLEAERIARRHYVAKDVVHTVRACVGTGINTTDVFARALRPGRSPVVRGAPVTRRVSSVGDGACSSGGRARGCAGAPRDDGSRQGAALVQNRSTGCDAGVCSAGTQSRIRASYFSGRAREHCVGVFFGCGVTEHGCGHRGRKGTPRQQLLDLGGRRQRC
jgi:hypothetical protein